HNPYIYEYSQMLSNTNFLLPVATHSIIDENTFPFQKDLYPDGHGHYYEMRNQLENIY
ncbi:7459_t:CDS:2, partial [Gigaspora rosea]